ncbi:preprotein translocase subunit SecE [Alphaproteobacteria bacterium]|jgi:preprotein translocase subunit SecE|nr:preprotein translocase subunit SecE [Alphaproteobacteria bacterium]
MANPLKFAQEVRSEARKVTWPTRSETIVTTVMVFILVFLASVFFFLADQILNWAVSSLLDLVG